MNLGYNLARVTTATTGTGTLTLGAAVLGYLTFAQAGVPNGATVSYGIADGINSEVGWGVYSTTGPTLTRNVYRSTGAGNTAPISLSGAAQVFITAVAEDFAALYSTLGILESDGAGNIGAAAPDQDYAVPAWAVDLDFANDLYWVAPYNSSNPINCSRASEGTVEYANGFWNRVPNNVLRRSDKGVLIEQARTNSLRNNSMQGVVAGSPGTLPTNWLITGSFGSLTQTIIGTGVEFGVDYIDIRFNGTTNNSFGSLGFETNTGIVAATGQTWANSFFVKLIGGSLTNVTLYQLTQELTAAGGFVKSNQSAPFVPGGSLARQSYVVALSGGGTVGRVNPSILFDWISGVAVDFTIRIGWPQMEQGSWATSPIRTTAAAATRAADVVSLNLPPAFGQAISLAASATPLAPSSYTALTQYVVEVDDGGFSNRVLIYRGSGNAAALTASGGVNSCNFTGFAWGENTEGTYATASSANNFAAAFEGTLAATDTAGPMPVGALDNVRIGCGATFSHQWNGYITRVLIWPRTRLGNALVQSVSAALPQATDFPAGGVTAGEVPPASVDLDFASEVFWSAPRNPRNPWNCSRASIGYIEDDSGVWIEVPANTLRWTPDKGALIESARTNSLRNNSMQGTVLGSPGTQPTNWTFAGPTGLTRTITAIGTTDGVEWIEFNFSGTTTGSGALSLAMETTTGIASVNGERWADSCFFSNPASTGVTSVTLQHRIVDSGAGTTINVVTGLVGAAWGRVGGTVTNNNAGTTNVRLFLATNTISSGVVVNYTFRVGWPQMELVPDANAIFSSPIRTTAGAATRAADVVRLTAPPPVLSEHSIFVQAKPNSPVGSSVDQSIVSLSNGVDLTNYLGIFRANTSGLVWAYLNSNVQLLSNAVLAQSTAARIAYSEKASRQLASVNGEATQQYIYPEQISGTTILEIGGNGFGQKQFDGYIERLVFWPRTRLDEVAIQNVSANAPNEAGHVTVLDTGTTTSDDAAAGLIGEYLSASAGGVALTSNVAATVTSLSLTAGDWEVWGSVVFFPAGTTTTTRQTAAIHTVAATLPLAPNNGAYAEDNASYPAGLGAALPAGSMRLALAATTTVYLIARAAFAVSTMNASGFIAARRRR